MPSTTKIDEYVVFYSTNAFAPRLGLYAAGKLIGQLNFEADGVPLPADSLQNGIPMLFYRKQDFANTLDILRNEKPVYLYFNGAGTSFENGLRTMQKPVKVIPKRATVAARPRRAR